MQRKLVELPDGFVALDDEEDSVVNDGDVKYKVLSKDNDRVVLQDNWGDVYIYDPRTDTKRPDFGQYAKGITTAVEDVRANKNTLEKDERGLLKEGVWYYHEWSDEKQEQGKGKSGIAPPNYFQVKSSPFTGKAFALKPGTSPSDAIRAFLAGPTVCDCGTFKNAVMYKSILELVGPDRFDATFARTLQLDADPTDANPAMKYFKRPRGKTQPGDVGYFKNHPCYQYIHPEGVADGWHVVCVELTDEGEPLWAGLGLDSPRTTNGVLKILVDEYNAPGVDLTEEKNARRVVDRSTQVDVGSTSKGQPLNINDVRNMPTRITVEELDPHHKATEHWMTKVKERTPPGFVQAKHRQPDIGKLEALRRG